ncbi:MAG: nicotinate-nucleotide--dimethylbenzimidazole phosphoribosyltransferase [Magnetococcales bacterium]|nr:nicotinate-nucleotide--dimethylbenzimidazole phosphoribosyltransferase [Magnetococcales bacterium]
MDPIKPVSDEAAKAARRRLDKLTKPKGSLGVLEELLVRLAAMQDSDLPSVDPARIVVFAGDHGIVKEGVSAYPQSVTLEMVRNFCQGGAAITVMARQLGVPIEVVDVGVMENPGALPGLISARAGSGTLNILTDPAMNPDQFDVAARAGKAAVDRAVGEGTKLFIGGEMGIGNTTAAASVVCALLGPPPESVAGPGTGLDVEGVTHKADVIQKILLRHLDMTNTPQGVMRRMGGFEMTALMGAYIRCGQVGIPVLVDGMIASACALVAATIHPPLKSWLIFSHRSAEPGQYPVFKALDAQPVLQLDMRLGEGSGAAAALPILRLACALQREMATFEEAGVSEKGSDVPDRAEVSEA